MVHDYVKHLGLVRRKAGMPLDDFVQHWMEVHAPMVARLPRLLRYSVNVVDHARSPDFEFDGISELWFASWEDFEAAFASPEAAALSADGPNFVGHRLTVRSREHQII